MYRELIMNRSVLAKLLILIDLCMMVDGVVVFRLLLIRDKRLVLLIIIPLWDMICIILSIVLRLCVIAMRRIVMLMVMELLMIPKQIGICHLCLRWI